jgi:hypothetical protein
MYFVERLGRRILLLGSIFGVLIATLLMSGGWGKGKELMNNVINLLYLFQHSS